jgi:superfamily II DNA/RNA helicase
MSDVSTVETDLTFSGREDFWMIAAAIRDIRRATRRHFSAEEKIRIVLEGLRGEESKIIIFIEPRDTLEYLQQRIAATVGANGVVVIHRGIAREARRAAIAAFNSDPLFRVMIANDAAGEGVNLQRGVHLMVNYDLPWNPNRLEQRFGRIQRIGQTEVCPLWNLCANNTREGEVYRRLLEKLEEARKAVGGKVYDVLGKLFEGQALHHLVHMQRHEKPFARPNWIINAVPDFPVE